MDNTTPPPSDAIAQAWHELAEPVKGAGNPVDDFIYQIEQRAREIAAQPGEGEFVLVPRASLKWWRELVNINPADLAPRIEAYLAAPPRVADALDGERQYTLPELPGWTEIEWPTLNRQALGCGVEDRQLHDRYECAEYGWQDGVDRAIECVPEEIYTAEQMKEYAQAAIAARAEAGVSK